MKFQVQTVAALALASGTATAFCPAPLSSHRHQQASTTDLAMAARDMPDFGKTAVMSFFAASVVAVSASGVVLPVEPAFAASASTAAKVEKVEVKKLAPEEKNKIVAKQNLDLSEQTLKEYTKYVSDAKGADAKASAALKNQEKVVAAAKKVVITDSDKLSAAKSQKMPETAVKELTVKSGT